MTYQAYINGMKGIIYYTFRSDTWNLQDDTTLWNQFQQLARENAALRDTLMNGIMTRQVDTGAQRYNVFCSYWTYKGKLLIMLANATNKSRNVSIPLPVGTTGTLAPKFPDTPAGMTFDNETRIISGAIQGTDVRIYELSFS